MRIWNYELRITDVQTIEVPAGTKALSVAGQDGTLCLWATVPEPISSVHARIRVVIIGTGNPAPSNPGRFIGTAVIGFFVWHVFVEEP